MAEQELRELIQLYVSFLSPFLSDNHPYESHALNCLGISVISLSTFPLFTAHTRSFACQTLTDPPS